MKRLSAELVQKIIFKYESEVMCPSDIAEHFGVSEVAVRKIIELREPTRNRTRAEIYARGRTARANYKFVHSTLQRKAT
jgi:transposase